MLTLPHCIPQQIFQLVLEGVQSHKSIYQSKKHHAPYQPGLAELSLKEAEYRPLLLQCQHQLACGFMKMVQSLLPLQWQRSQSCKPLAGKSIYITIMSLHHKPQVSHQNDKPQKTFYNNRIRTDHSMDSHSQKKDVHRPLIRKAHLTSGLPKQAQFSSRNSQPQSQPHPYSSHRQTKESVSPKGRAIDPNPKELTVRSRIKQPVRSEQKQQPIVSVSRSRYHLKQALDRQTKKNYTSPHSVEHSSLKQETSRVLQREGSTFNVRAVLTTEEWGKFGDRFPEKFSRIGLLGRGGFSVVWLGVHRASKRRVALKQILSKNPYETHLKQIWFCSYFFQKGGQPREEFTTAIGINNICRLYTYDIQNQDSWLYYELCQQSLANCLFQLKGQTNKGERSYRIQFGELLYRMRNNIQQLRHVVVQIAKALTLMNSHSIVHSDLKTENIMIKRHRGGNQRQGDLYIRDLKLIDFGSSFLFNNLRQFSMATPEYMPPEILNYILFQNKMEHDKEMLGRMSLYKNAWTIDIWSLGCIILQIVSGVPLWMSVNTHLSTTSTPATGLFSAKNRVFSKIIQKQIHVVEQLDYHLTHHNYSGIILSQDLKEALKQMLHLEPMKRISPWELLTLLGVKCEAPIIPAY